MNCSLSLTEHFIAFCPQGIMLVGDGYRGKTSPHTPNEKFEGATVLKALKVNPLLPLSLGSLGWWGRRRGWGGACEGPSREGEFRRSSCGWIQLVVLSFVLGAEGRCQHTLCLSTTPPATSLFLMIPSIPASIYQASCFLSLYLAKSYVSAVLMS